MASNNLLEFIVSLLCFTLLRVFCFVFTFILSSYFILKTTLQGPLPISLLLDNETQPNTFEVISPVSQNCGILFGLSDFRIQVLNL